MCSEFSVSVTGLAKRYLIYEKPHHRLLQGLWRGHKQFFRDFWALHGVSFRVGSGQTVGIIGRNGSGKSTLLQIIAGTLTATSGDVRVNGRVSALLELGSGFNPEFSGRENVFLNGAILGMGREEMESRFERIATFSGIGDYMEQPVKTYSSGMYARLGFSVAIHTDPDILIVDEALSVGDEAFQRKCFARIQEIKELGATILFVSHAGGTVVELCDHAVLLDRGELLLQGPPKQVVSVYQKLLYAPADRADVLRQQIKAGQEPPLEVEGRPHATSPFITRGEEPEYDPALVPQSTLAYESQGAEIRDPHVESLFGTRVNILVHGEEYVYAYEVSFSRSSYCVVFGMLIKTLLGVEVGGGSVPRVADPIPFLEAGARFRVQFRFRCLLNPGIYFLNAGVMGLVGGAHTYLDRRIDVAMFRVKPVSLLCATGIVDFDLTPALERIDAA